MSNDIARKYVGAYTFVYTREGDVLVEIQGHRHIYDICNALCDEYGGESHISCDVIVPFDDYIKYAWLRVFPHMKYAYDKCSDTVTADKMAMLVHCNKHPCLEPLLNNPHNKKYACLNYMWRNTSDSVDEYERAPAKLKQAIRNFHDPSIELDMHVPLSKAHKPQYKWVMGMIKEGHMDEFILSDIALTGLSEKDMNYVIKLHAKAPRELRLDEVWIALEAYVSYAGMLRECVLEGLLPNNVLDDPYWVYPSPAAYLNRRNRVRELLEYEQGSKESHEEFDNHMERYKKYPVDITVDGFRFYTTTSREDWISHSDALKQCCYRLKYYSHDTSILTFVEKDGVPYGTIDYSLEHHHVQQARIDQTVYSESNMPYDVVKLFNKHVVRMLENN